MNEHNLYVAAQNYVFFCVSCYFFLRNGLNEQEWFGLQLNQFC